MIAEDAGAEVGILAYGSSHWAILEARDQLTAAGIKSGYCLVKALPLHADVRAFIERYRRLYVVEQNRDAQMAQIVKVEMPALAANLRSVLHYTGLPIDARSVTDDILLQEGASVTVKSRPVPQETTR